MNRRILAYFWAEAPRWILWWPVGLGLGIAGYFCLPHEPTAISLLIMLGGGSFLTWHFWPIQPIRFVLLSLLSILIGFCTAKIRTERISPVMLDRSVKQVDLKGQILELDYRHQQWRCLLQVSESTPFLSLKKVRLNLRHKPENFTQGAIVQLIADLYPVPFPVTPSGFDFRRQAFFQGISASGRILEILAIHHSPDSSPLSKLRQKLNHALLSRLSPHSAALAIAFITGERGYIPEFIRQDFINSGLAHLLAISGLHLGLLAGIVFFVLRRGLGLYPLLLEKYNIKKVAAGLSIPLVFFYLALSGWGLPAQRAFIMITIVMLAIIYDYQAISMRLVAFAATLILFIQPESLLNASFQLSFAAVIGLIAFYEQGWLSLQQWHYQGGILRRLTGYFIGLISTTLVASLATLPFTIAMFNRFTLQALLGNLLAIPLMGLIIMPSLLLMVLSHLTGPIYGLDHLTALALQWLISIAHFVSHLPGSTIELSTPGPGFLWCCIFGGLWLCLWQQPWRYWGLILIALAPLFLEQRAIPNFYITSEAIGVTNHDTQSLTIYSKRASPFLIDQWRKEAIGYRVIWHPKSTALIHEVGVLLGSPSFKSIQHICQRSQIVIILGTGKNVCRKMNAFATFIDHHTVQQKGTHFIWLGKKNRILTIADLIGKRPWGISDHKK
jgi:competence protein ComEC